ncbi:MULTISPECIES: response regulator [Deferrisoma]
MRVLVADDDAISRRVATKILSDLGCEVTAVDGGLAALEAMSLDPPHVLLTDWVMPDLGGEDLIRMARAQGFQGTIWFACPREGAENREAGLAAGADAPVHKPFDRDEVARLLADLTKGG